MPPTPITRFTRVVLSLDLVFSLVAGLDLYVLSTHTDDAFAWTLKLPITAAFLGAGYLGAILTLLPSYRTNEWQRVRILPVMGFTLTFATAVVTLWHLGEFHLGAGSTSARLAGWAWLVVYLAVPCLLVAVFVRQERAGGRNEYAVAEPLLPLTRIGVLGQALLTGIVGLGLVLAPDAVDGAWPWPLTPLAAGAVGAWLLTIACGALWIVRERDWRRVRVAFPGLACYAVLVSVAAARYHSDLAVGAAAWAWLAALAVASTVTACGAWQQEQRCRAPEMSPARAAVSE